MFEGLTPPPQFSIHLCIYVQIIHAFDQLRLSEIYLEGKNSFKKANINLVYKGQLTANMETVWGLTLIHCISYE